MKNTKQKFILFSVGFVLVGGLGFYGYHSYVYVGTNDASIEAKTTLLSSQINGTIESIQVEDNQEVKKDQVLATLRPVDYRNALNSSKAEYESLAAQQRSAELTFKRTLALSQEGAVTQERLDAAQAQYRSLTEKLKAAEVSIKQSEENFSHTQIKAPTDGKIAKKSIEVGMSVNAGQPLMGFVAGGDRWVIANFKETELAGIEPGKMAKVSVDAVSGKTFVGVVDSISPSTGAAFSLLPPDNAVGNFTKVVQRVPVKIKLLNLSEADVRLLQAGLSAEVSVKRH